MVWSAVLCFGVLHCDVMWCGAYYIQYTTYDILYYIMYHPHHRWEGTQYHLGGGGDYVICAICYILYTKVYYPHHGLSGHHTIWVAVRLYTVYHTPYTEYYILYTICYTRYAIYYMLYTIYQVLHTMCYNT